MKDLDLLGSLFKSSKTPSPYTEQDVEAYKFTFGKPGNLLTVFTIHSSKTKTTFVCLYFNLTLTVVIVQLTVISWYIQDIGIQH